MPIDPITPKAPAAPTKLAAKSLNDPSFSALVQQDLKAGLKPGPKLSQKPTDGFTSMKTPDHFLPLNRNVGAPSPPLTAASVEALGATTKHPLGPQKR